MWTCGAEVGYIRGGVHLSKRGCLEWFPLFEIILNFTETYRCYNQRLN